MPINNQKIFSYADLLQVAGTTIGGSPTTPTSSCSSSLAPPALLIVPSADVLNKKPMYALRELLHGLANRKGCSHYLDPLTNVPIATSEFLEQNPDICAPHVNHRHCPHVVTCCDVAGAGCNGGESDDECDAHMHNRNNDVRDYEEELLVGALAYRRGTGRRGGRIGRTRGDRATRTGGRKLEKPAHSNKPGHHHRDCSSSSSGGGGGGSSDSGLSQKSSMSNSSSQERSQSDDEAAVLDSLGSGDLLDHTQYHNGLSARAPLRMDKEGKKRYQRMLRLVNPALRPHSAPFIPAQQMPDIEDVRRLPRYAQSRRVHLAAIDQGYDCYRDLYNGCTVFCKPFLSQVPCCGQQCKHCPYGHRPLAFSPQQAIAVMNEEIVRQQERAAKELSANNIDSSNTNVGTVPTVTISSIPNPPQRPGPIFSNSTAFTVTDTRRNPSHDALATLLGSPATANQPRSMRPVGSAEDTAVMGVTTPNRDVTTPMFSLINSPVNSSPSRNDGGGGIGRGSGDKIAQNTSPASASTTSPSGRRPVFAGTGVRRSVDGFNFNNSSTSEPLAKRQGEGRSVSGTPTVSSAQQVSSQASVLATWARAGFGGLELQHAHSHSMSTDSLIDLSTGVALAAAGRRHSHHTNPNIAVGSQLAVGGEEGSDKSTPVSSPAAVAAAGGGANAAASLQQQGSHFDSRRASSSTGSSVNAQNLTNADGQVFVRKTGEVSISIADQLGGGRRLPNARISSRDLEGLLLDGPDEESDGEDDEEDYEEEESSSSSEEGEASS